MEINSFLKENAACCDYISFTLATQTAAAVESCRLEEKLECLMMERRSVMKEFVMACASAALTVATVGESCLEEKCECLMMERRGAMQEFTRARLSVLPKPDSKISGNH